MEDYILPAPRTVGVLLLAFFSAFLSTVQGQDLFYFNIKPQNQDVVEGSEAKLYCDVSDRLHIAFQWMQGGKLLENTSRKYQEDSNLRIMRILRGVDEGPFECVATNVTTGFSLKSQEALLNIQWISKTSSVVLRRPGKSEVQVGSNITLRCQVSGNPQPTILWYNNRFRLFTSERFKILDSGSRLKLINVTAADNGVISCSSENMAGSVDSHKNFLLNVKARGTPRLVEERFTPYMLAMKNQDARLDCPFQGASRIDWFANYAKLTNSTRHQVFENGSLYFPNVRPSDGGSYRCEGLSKDAPAQTFTVELALSSLEDITHATFEPRLRPNYPIVIPALERFEIKVFPPGGQPPPQYKWMDRNDRQIGPKGNVHVDGTNLVFEQPIEKDTGNYTFVISNTAGSKRKKVWITVSVPPTISRDPKSIPRVAAEDGVAKLSCQVVATAYPVTIVLWKKDGHMISPGSKRHRMNLKDGELIIPRVQARDEGVYQCVANTTGHPVKESGMAQLKVTRKLKFNPYPKKFYYLELNKPAKIECKAEAATSLDIHWLHVGQGKKLPKHVFELKGTLHFEQVRREDEGKYTCVAIDRQKSVINTTVTIKIVQTPKFKVHPANETTAYEGRVMFLHCFALGDPKPQVNWEKDGRHLISSTSAVDDKESRFKIFPNGTLVLREVLMEDKGRYGCKANNSAGEISAEFNLRVTLPEEDEDDGFDMGKTIIIAVCSAGAYLALVIGLSAYCSYKLLAHRKSGKQLINSKDIKLGGAEHNLHHREQHELLMKDRDSGMQGRSDSDNRSHASGLSSHPSQSSASAVPPPSHISSAMALARARGVGADKFQFPRQEIQTLGIIGKSQFGDVFLAKARGIRPIEPETLVMVKSLLVKGEVMAAEFQREMDMYGKLEHPNIVKLLGICKETEPVFMITEYCDWGDLKQFLLATRSDNGRRQITPRVPTLSFMQKTKMCQQVALAMEYLSSYKFVHKDLAARNILLTSRMDLKVCSLSLCCDVYAKEYYRVPNAQSLMPLRWLPPEAIRDSDYSFYTDIWSYGIFLWEVFHLADLPYRLLSDDDVFNAMYNVTAISPQITMRLDFAEHCPSQVADIVQQCCVPSPSKRPTFSDLVVTLGHLLTKGDCV